MNSPLRDEICLLHAHLCSGLAEPNRILLLYSLARQPGNVSELVAELELPQPTVSRHLRVLRDCGLVNGVRRGHKVVYHLRDRRVIAALDMLRVVLAATLTKQGVLATKATELSTMGQ